jgi:aspartyl-tRNA(Asn)/glutamyl-tRNA(Gln) amidotransferase subunit A
MRNPPLHELGVAELLAGYRAGAFDPVEVVDDCLARLAGVPQEAMGVVTVVADGARIEAAASAARWTAGTPRPLEGVA